MITALLLAAALHGSPQTPDLDRVNREVNRAHVAGSVWLGADADEDFTWDCENYADAKRQRLLGEGVSPDRLALEVVVTRDGTRHMVLVVDGDKVLDNLQYYAQSRQSLERVGYRWTGERR